MNSTECLSSKCRICLQDGANYPIFDESKVDYNIHSQLTKCFMEKIEDLDGYPRNICSSCKITLDLLCEFIDKYRKSCEMLRESLVQVKTEVDDTLFENFDNFIWDDQEEYYVVIQVENRTEEKYMCDSSEIIQKLKPLPGLKITKVESKKCLKQKQSKKITRKTKNSELATKEGEMDCDEKERRGLTKTCKLEENLPKKSVNIIVQKNVNIKENQNTENSLVICNYCQAVFDKKDELQNHIEIHNTMNAPVCRLCLRKYKTEKQLKKHNNIYHSEKKFQCEHCFKMFAQRWLLNSHIKLHTKLQKTSSKLEKNPPKKRFICDYCRAAFDKKDELKNHIEFRHIMNAPLICALCSKSFKTEQRLKNHTIRNHGEKKIQCDHCFKMFTRRCALNDHMKNHTGRNNKKRYSCKFCDKTYASQKWYIVHERSVHTGLRPAVCEVCGKAFYHDIYLKEHMRLHTGELPFKCPFCDRGCTQRGNLKSHLRQHKMSEVNDTIKSNMKPGYWKYLKND